MNNLDFSVCPREDLNLQPFRDVVLSHARMPIPPRGQLYKYKKNALKTLDFPRSIASGGGFDKYKFIC